MPPQPFDPGQESIRSGLPSACPGEAALRQFLRGKTSAADSEAIAEHLQVCAVCLTALDQLEHAERSEDAALENLRESVIPDNSVYQGALAKAIAVPLNARPPERWTAGTMFQVGTIVGDYHLLSLLGQGGMGTVFLAEHATMRRRVALKALTAGRQDNVAFVRRFIHEIRTTAQLNHPRFVPALDAGECQGLPYLVMEYVDGCSLHEVVRRWGRLPVAEACEIGRQVAEGLLHLQERGLIHRDLKPSNLMLTLGVQIPILSAVNPPLGNVDSVPAEADSKVPFKLAADRPKQVEVKILDFGVARWLESTGMTQAATLPSLIIGTLEYMAPEQVEDSSRVDACADWYSLGATMFKMLVGKAPLELLEDTNALGRAQHLTTEDAPGIRSLRPDVPRRLGRVIDRLLAREPQRRPQISEVMNALRLAAADAETVRLLDEMPEQPSTTPAGLTTRTLRLRRIKRRLKQWSGVAFAVLLVSLGCVELWVLEPSLRWDKSRISVVQENEPHNSPNSTQDTSDAGVLERKSAFETIESNFLAATDVGEAGRLVGHHDLVPRLSISPDGLRAVSASERDHLLIYWDLKTGQPLREFRLHTDWVRTVSILQDGEFCLSGSADRSLVLFRLADGEIVRRFKDHSSWVLAADVIPGRRQFVSAGGGFWGGHWRDAEDRELRVWDIESAQVLRRLHGHTGAVRVVKVSPDGKWIASASQDRTVRIWSIETGQEVRRLEGFDDVVESVAWRPDSRTLVTPNLQEHLRVWDVETGEFVREVGPLDSPANQLAISPDGRHLLTSHGHDPVVRMWDLETGRKVYAFPGNSSQTYPVAFAGPPPSRFALVGGGTGNGGPDGDYALRLWRLP